MIRYRSTSAFLLLLALFAFGLASPAAAADGRFTIRFYGGLGLYSGGDINEAGGMADYYSNYLEDLGFSIDGEFHAAHFGLEAGADFIFNITPSIGIGLGVGYLNASRESLITMAKGSVDFTQTIRAAYGSVPLRLGVFWTIPISAKISVALSAGPELHLANASTFWEYAEDYDDFARMENNITGTGLGFFGSAAFEIKLSGTIGLLLEITGRYARFGGLTGSLTTEDSQHTESTSGTLYLLEIPYGSSDFPFLMVVEEKPGGAAEAKLDLSGGSIRFGVAIHI
jgi:hypothetical protein